MNSGSRIAHPSHALVFISAMDIGGFSHLFGQHFEVEAGALVPASTLDFLFLWNG
jgi:hypothetical protein